MKYFVCNNVRELLGSSGHSRRHHEGSGDKERQEERRQGDREERRHEERSERRQADREERRQGDREMDKTLSGMEGLSVSSDSPSTEVTHSLMLNQDLTGDTIHLKCQETKFTIDKANTSFTCIWRQVYIIYVCQVYTC